MNKEFFKLNELQEIVFLKPRMLKQKMKKVKEKYKHLPHLLYKEGRCWNIHKSIIFEFDRLRLNLNKYNFKSFISISFEDNVSIDYIKNLMKILFKEMSENRKTFIYYIIEKNKKNNLHIHFLTNWEKNKADEVFIYDTLKNYSSINFQMLKITNYRNLNEYLNKDYVFKQILK